VVCCHDHDVTQTIARPRPAAARRRQAQAAPVSPLWLRSLLTAIWSSAVGLAVLVVLSLIDWTADSRATSSAATAMRFAVAMWLDAQRAPLHVPGGTIAVAPLGLSLLLAGLLARFARVLSRDAPSQRPGAVAAMVFAVSVPYGGIAAALALVARSDSIRPSPGTAFIAATGFSVLATTVGGMRGAGQWSALWDRLNDTTQSALKAAGAAAAVLLASSTVLTAAALIEHHKLIGDSLAGYGNGSGQFTMALLSIWLIPNAILLSLAYLTGTGFVVGSGASVTIGHSHVGATPALPILAAIPHGGASWVVVVLAVAAIGGAAALAARQIHRGTGIDLATKCSAALGLAATIAAGTALLEAVAGGPAGPGRLATFGPSPWKVALSVAFEIAGPVIVFVSVQAAWRTWRANRD
jgi:hypothetical protein